MLIPHLNLICQSHMLGTHHTNLQSVSLEGLFAKTSSVKELFLIHFLLTFILICGLYMCFYVQNGLYTASNFDSLFLALLWYGYKELKYVL